MRQILATLMLVALTQGAAAQQNPIKTDPMDKPDTNGAVTVAPDSRQAVVKVMQDAGFKEVQLSDALLVQAKDQQDQPVMLLVDPKSMVAIQLQMSPDGSETTGSGARPDNSSGVK